MRYTHELITVGLATATLAGCGGNNPEAAQPVNPAVRQYDISSIECDGSEAILEAAAASKAGKELTIKGLAGPKPNIDIVTNADGGGPEIINPAVITCNGAIKYAIGLDRGFDGREVPTFVKTLATNTSFSRVDLRKGKWQPKRIPLKRLSRYVVETTVRDRGPAKAGVSGFVATRAPINGFAVMP